MTELSGTLEGVGLPAIVRFLTGLKKTGCLRIVHNDWRGEIVFDLGHVTGASLGSRKGLSALDALVQALPGGSFTFDAASATTCEANISLSAEALQAHLDELAIQTANGTSPLPSFDAVPALVAQDTSSSGEEPLPLDRGTLQTLLAVDGQRTVREIVAQRGSLDALWQLGNLVEVGLIGLNSTAPASVEPTDVAAAPVEPTFVAAAPVEPAPVEPTAPRPFALDLAPDDTTARCPKLGFADDPDNSVGRPTRLHRCFAAGAPLPLSLDQQRELCLSDQFGTCPRLTMGAFVPPARDEQATWGGPATRRPGTRRAEPEGDDSRIVRLPFVARANAAERGAVSDRQAVGGSEPTRFRPAGGPLRDGASTPPTPLRARIERSTSLGSTGAVAEPAASATPEARTKESKSVRQTLMDDPAERRLGGIPVGLIAGVVVVLAILGVIGYLLTPYLGDLLVDESVDPSLLPNTSAVAAGTPIAQVTSARVTPVTGATVGTDPGAAPSDAASTKPAPGAASASSAATAAPAPTLLPEPAQAAPAKAAVAAAQPAGNTLLDERFTSNDRNWPSSAQGPAFLINGSYRMMTRQAAQFVAVGAPIADVLQDVVVNATFHKLNGPSGGGYGIIVRDQAPAPQNGTSQDGHYYVLEVGDTGEVGMWRRDGDHWVDLLPWQPNPAVKAGNATNELSVRAVGDRLSLSVNGTQVATRTDTTFSSGSVGLFVGGDGNQVAVDHFSIQTP